jgi:hypothetical protein
MVHDHNPLLISCHKLSSTKNKIFHIQAAWMSHPDYENLVDRTWLNSNGNVVWKLDEVKKQSIIFNRDTFGNIFKRKRQLEARIKGVHIKLDVCPRSDLINLEMDLQRQYSIVLEEEELLWYQKSRENWIKFGNKNTKF